MPTFVKYNSFLKNQMNGTAVVDFNTDTIKVSLHTSSYTPSASADEYWDDVDNEVTGDNYTSGGSALTSLSLTESSGTITFDAADLTWSQDASGFDDARYAVLYKDTGTDSTSPLIGYADLGSDKTTVSGDYTLKWSTSGIITWA
jgi:hypothetical protein